MEEIAAKAPVAALVVREQLSEMARIVRELVTSTPALWSDIHSFASSWTSSVDAKWASLRLPTIAALAAVRDAERNVLSLIAQQSDGPNSRAAALIEIQRENRLPTEDSYFVCEGSEQAKAVASFLRYHPLQHVQPIFLRQLPVSQNCIVAGWLRSHFARRLYAHAPHSILAIVDEKDQERWRSAANTPPSLRAQSILSFADGQPPSTAAPSASAEKSKTRAADPAWQEDERTPCAFLWLAGESAIKIVPRDARVVVQHGNLVREQIAIRLKRNDRVILGSGSGRWSPADEFTEALVEAVEASHPELVKIAKEWRRALSEFRDAHRLSTSQLRARLADMGVTREVQTLDGWLQLDRASPIAPKGYSAELAAIFSLIKPFARNSLEEILASCKRLRALRIATGRALLDAWKGRAIDLGVDEAWIGNLLARLRREVQVYEIEAVTLAEIPPSMLGWWLPLELVTRFESSSHQSDAPEPGGDGHPIGAAPL